MPSFDTPINSSAFDELARQEIADDAKFWDTFTYLFELQVPPNALEGDHSGIHSYLFPLVVAPQAISVADPFTLNVTMTSYGSAYIEENGVVVRPITIMGTTGFKPRKLPVAPPRWKYKTEAFNFSFRGNDAIEKFSGQRHFQFLQDRVFRVYGELKRNPETSKGTELIFHNIKDDEHWRVVPAQFVMQRDAKSSRFTYPYRIDLLALNRAEDLKFTEQKEERAFSKGIKSPIAAVKGFMARLREGIAQIKSGIDRVVGVVRDAVRLVQNAVDILNAVTDFVQGVTRSILAPFKMVADLIGGLDDAITALENLDDYIRDEACAAWREVADAVDGLASHKELFSEDVNRRLEELRGGSSALIAAPLPIPIAPTSQSTLPTSVDVVRILNPPVTPKVNTQYRSVVPYRVTQADTLVTIATAYLGDPEEWPAIAALNNLRPPYISALGLPGTVAPGTTVLLPSKRPPPPVVRSAGILNVPPEASVEDRVLGVDWLLDEDSQGRADVRVRRTSEGATDFVTVHGKANLIQALRLRLRTERGTDLLYPQLGVLRIGSVGVAGVDRQMLRLRFRQAIEADPRIVRVTKIQLAPSSSADTVLPEIEAVVRGFDTNTVLNTVEA